MKLAQPKSIFPADFIVLDMEEDKEIPIILGKPFLATGGALIDVQKGELKLRVQNDEITFHVFRPMKLTNDNPNKDTPVLHPKEILQGEVVNSRCHAPIPCPTRLVNPNWFRDAKPYTGTLYLFFFFFFF